MCEHDVTETSESHSGGIMLLSNEVRINMHIIEKLADTKLLLLTEEKSEILLNFVFRLFINNST